MVMSVRMAPPLPLIFLLMIYGVSNADWGVSYSHPHICALKDSSVIMSCSYTYPTGHQIMKVFWTKGPLIMGEETPDLSEDPEYRHRLQYLGNNQQNCTIRLSHVTQKDQQMYYFRFKTNIDSWTGLPGVNLTVKDHFSLQVESPENVTEGDSVRLTCKSNCTLTDRATFIWYRNSQPLPERRDNELLLQSVRREDAGKYSCALHVHTYISPAVHLSVMYGIHSSNAVYDDGVVVGVVLVLVLVGVGVLVYCVFKRWKRRSPVMDPPQGQQITDFYENETQKEEHMYSDLDDLQNSTLNQGQQITNFYENETQKVESNYENLDDLQNITGDKKQSSTCNISVPNGEENYYIT